MQTPSSLKPYPGGQTHSSRSLSISPLPGGHVFTGVHSSEASPSYPSRQTQVMVRTGRVSSTLHSALIPQGSASLHRSTHWFLRQTVVGMGQSLSWMQSVTAEKNTPPLRHLKRNGGKGQSDFSISCLLPILHVPSRSPTCPGGHLQLTSCPTTRHSSVGSHGFRISQGSSHTLLMQAWSGGHSVLWVHSRLLQVTNGSPVRSGGQWQV